jgi:hypothetical protein
VQASQDLHVRVLDRQARVTVKDDPQPSGRKTAALRPELCLGLRTLDLVEHRVASGPRRRLRQHRLHARLLLVREVVDAEVLEDGICPMLAEDLLLVDELRNGRKLLR